jgi:hypothetical protein
VTKADFTAKDAKSAKERWAIAKNLTAESAENAEEKEGSDITVVKDAETAEVRTQMFSRNQIYCFFLRSL